MNSRTRAHISQHHEEARGTTVFATIQIGDPSGHRRYCGGVADQLTR
jgi:hypothetical protein